MKSWLSGFYLFCLYTFPPFTEAEEHFTRYTDNVPAICDSVPRSRINYQIITNTDKSYGYDIYVNGLLRVHQPAIPGMQGTRGFQRRGDAIKIANLVIRKIKNGLMPPTISLRELDSLRIKF